MSKPEIVTKTKENQISVCDIMKTNTSQIIQKLENQAPARFQQYSDLYSEYLHTIDDLFGTCYISEKEFFDKLNIDQGILKQTKDYSQAITNIITDQIDFAGKYRQEFIKSQISYLKIFDNFVHVMMDSYSKTLANANQLTNSSQSAK